MESGAAMKPIKDLKVKYTEIFINNEWCKSSSGKTFGTFNPATEAKTADIQEGDAADINAAVAAARQAFALGSPYRRMDASARGKLLLKLADAIERDADKLATLETLDNGMHWSMSSTMPDVATGILRYHVGAVDKLCGKTIPIDGDFFCYTRLEPVGVCGAIIPWNFPIEMIVNKIAMAIASGCTLVVKPAEDTPLTALYIASLVKEVGIPPGVVNVVPGYGKTAGSALANHMDVDMISFTESTATGRLIVKASAESNLKKFMLELGGKSPNIVFSDVDLDYAVEMAHQALFLHNGQVCISGSRTFVQEDIYDKFVEKSVERAKQRKVGDPFNTDIESGPQINTTQVKKVMDLIDSGINQGAKLHCGGHEIKSGKGHFVEQTVFSNVTDDMRIAKEEIFGPVMQIMKFKDINEVINRANNTSYGLAAAVFTKDINKAITIANTLQAGTVWINTYFDGSAAIPFGGYKQSGIGREKLLSKFRRKIRKNLLGSLFCQVFNKKHLVYKN